MKKTSVITLHFRIELQLQKEPYLDSDLDQNYHYHESKITLMF